jgi:hypothetical protein
MDRYLIEVPHAETELACARVVRTFLEIGSHYLTNADWGCEDGDHRAWMIVEADSKEEARLIVPPPLRTQAIVVQLNKFNMRDIEDILSAHDG